MLRFQTTALALVGVLCATAPNTASAAEADRLTGTIVAGAGLFPEYEGASKLKAFPLINGQVNLGQRYIAIEGLTTRVNVLGSAALEAGPIANLTFGRDAKVDSAAVALLPARKDALELGGFIGWRIETGGGDTLRFAIQAAHDATGVHKGWLGQASAAYTASLGKRFAMSAEAAASFADNDYAGTYFSVSPADSLKSGLRPFVAKGGIKDVGVTLSARYALSDRWSLNGLAGYRRLLGDFADSPIVKDEGDANQLIFGVGIGFSF
jgi:outer membrane scaffolding protein for murein synthesis (MipA/OmpV family)